MKPLILLLLTATLTFAGPKIAVVDVEKIFKHLHVSLDSEKEFQERNEILRKNERFEALNKTDRKLKKLAAKVRDQNLDEKQRDLALAEFQTLSNEYRALANDLEQFLATETNKLRQAEVERTETILAQIRNEVNQVGKEEKFDLILETGGNTSSQLPAVIYLRNGIDITEQVLHRLNSGNIGNRIPEKPSE